MVRREIKFFGIKNITEAIVKDALWCVKSDTETEFKLYVTDLNGNLISLKDLTGGGGAGDVVNSDGSITITGTTTKNIKVSTALQLLINSALQSGDNISELLNDEGYITLADIPTFNPADYDLTDFTNLDADPFARVSEIGVGGNTNLGYEASPTAGVVTSNTGADATIPAADATNAGLLLPAEKTLIGTAVQPTDLATVATTGDYNDLINQPPSLSVEDVQLLYNDSSTGVTKFEGFTINADNTKYNLGLVEGWFVDNVTDPNNPTKTFKSFPATTANTLTNIATQNVTYIAIDINGVHQQSGVPFEPELQRDWIPLGVIVHSNRTTINAINNQPVVALSPNNQLSDLMESIGFFNISGNVFSPNGANLNLNKSAGQIFKQGVNFLNDNKDPHTLILNALVAPTNIRYRTQLGVESADTAVVAPNFWDNAGVLTAMTGTRWSIQRIYVFQSNLIRIQYGQATYTNKADAIQAIATEPFVVEQNILENGLFRGLLIVRNTTTDLTDIDRALFIEASKFGNVAGLGSLSTTSLQQAYNNSTTPEIVTDATLGAFTVKRGSAADTDNIIEGQNGAGTTTFQVTGAGVVTGNNLSGTNTGDNAANTTSNSYADGKVADTITNGVTTIAPSQNVVFDALALKASTTHTHAISDVTNLQTTLDAKMGVLLNCSALATPIAGATHAVLYQQTMLAGTVADLDVYEIEALMEKTGIVGSSSIRIWTDTATTFNAGTAILLATSPTNSAGNLFGTLKREFHVRGTNVRCLLATIGIATDESTGSLSANSWGTYAQDPTVANTFYFTVTGNAADTFQKQNFKVTKLKAKPTF